MTRLLKLISLPGFWALRAEVNCKRQDSPLIRHLLLWCSFLYQSPFKIFPHHSQLYCSDLSWMLLMCLFRLPVLLNDFLQRLHSYSVATVQSIRRGCSGFVSDEDMLGGGIMAFWLGSNADGSSESCEMSVVLLTHDGSISVVAVSP